MTTNTKQLLATLAGYPILWLFSAIIHMIDANLNGFEGFLSLIAEPSVYVVAAFLFMPCIIAVHVYASSDMRAYWAVLVGTALLIGGLLTISGSTASDFWGYAVSFGGASAVCALFLMPGTAPGVLFLRTSGGLQR